MWSKLLVVACLAAVVNADVYMQYPKGSNNRLNEANRGRNNANRLFDSQNNNRGGYNAGNVYFYAGTTMHIEWTNQHSCGGPNNHCEMILQYMCDPRLRDGSTTNTIPTTAASDGNPTFGRHESFDYYTNQCLYRSRNRGLFTANRNLQTNNGRNGAIYTRQNENGDRYGYECPEERDYYPYWHPTQWRDIAIFTNQPEKCPAYISSSQNVAERYYCNAPSDWIAYQASMGRNGFIPINGTECIKIRSLYQVDQYNNTVVAQWTFVPSFGIAPPYCTGNRFTRDNHLGNVEEGFPNGYNWTIPADIISERCTLRLRYNISTGEYAAFADTNAYDANGNAISAVAAPANLTYLNNSRTGNTAPTANRDPAYIDVWSKYGLQWTDVNISFNRQTNDPNGATIKASRDYVFKDNPKVDIFGNGLIPKSQSGDPTQPAMIRLQLAINTDQFGRTFEDRSHRFAIRSMPDSLQGVRVHNLQVKGKRGNIVQNFPATEYDFWPKRLQVQTGEYIHFQWTGSNNNGDNNAGRGKAGTDRHNVLLLRAPVFPYLQRTQERNDARNAVPTIGALGSTYPTRIDGTNATFLGFSRSDLKSLATWSTYQYGGDMDQGDDAGTYFDLGPRQVNNVKGIFNYACSRNNDFSNRDQKAQIIVSDESAVFQALGIAGGTLRADSGASLEVPAGAFTTQVVVTLLTAPSDSSSSFSGSVNSDYVTIIPINLPLAPGATVRINVPYQNKPLVIPQLYRSDSMNGDWSTVDGASYSGGVASADVSQGGTYVVQTQVNWGAVVGIIVGAVGFVGIVVGVMYWRFKKQQQTGGGDSKMAAKV